MSGAIGTTTIFGFELLNKIYNPQIQKEEDVLILFVHWFLVNNENGFRCIGIGDHKVIEASEKGSELLPDGWNQMKYYALRYIKEGKLYILHGTKSDDDLLINLLRVEDNGVSNTQFPIKATVKELHGPLETLLPAYQTIIHTLRTELIEPVYKGSATSTSTQTSSTSQNAPAPQIPPQFPLVDVRPGVVPPMGQRPPEADPLRVGGADLDPFRRGGGGMIFNPFVRPFGPGGQGGLGVPGRLPPGAVPPGARFDPFGPPDVDRPRPLGRGPDNDHLPPPGYDDMFM